MNSRERVLQRLRQHAPPAAGPLAAPAPDADVFRDLPADDQDALLARFEERLAALSGEFFCVANEDEAAACIGRLAADAEDGPLLAQEAPLVTDVLACMPELAESFSRVHDLSAPEMATYSVGLTAADCLVARTGSVVLRSTSGGGRRLSVLPPMHIVLARAEQIVPSLEDAAAVLGGTNEAWSYATIITGPSRTADIEKILVLGAHGPKRLAVIVLA